MPFRPSDAQKLHQKVMQLLIAVTDLRQYAFAGGGRLTITERAQIRLLFQLDYTLMDFFHQRHLDEPHSSVREMFGPNGTHQLVVDMGREACEAVRRGVRDYRAESNTDDGRWADLWHVYPALYRVGFAFFRIDRTKPATVTVDVAEDGKMVERVTSDIYNHPAPENDWHPEAWPAVCKRLADLPPVDGCPRSAGQARNKYWEQAWQTLAGRLEQELEELLAANNQLAAPASTPPAQGASDDAGQDVGADAVAKKVGKRGRKRINGTNESRRLAICDAWDRFKSSGAPGDMSEFCKTQKPPIKEKELERALNWRRTRKRRADSPDK